MLHPLPVQPNREDVFVERYQRLHAWSLQMTERDHELAEDLLHDLFIQFTRNAPELHEIHDLDAYLYTMLRNLHLSQRRHETRNRLQQLSIVEYDSAEIGLRTVDSRDHIQAQEDLRHIARYACVRKETSKTASVLILRFFHGYYPEEIVKILRAARPLVDTSLRLARKEAKAGLLSEPNNANRLEFINRGSLPQAVPTGYAQNIDVVLEEIREMIFSTKKGECFTDDSLEQLYDADTADPIGCAQLSHLVSCYSCLEKVNSLLGLPSLAERNATETLGRDTRKRGGPGGGGTVTKNKLNQLRRRAKDMFAHKPAQLCVAVNGYTLGSHHISSERSELSLVVDEEVRVSFVEVFSEQKIRLLLMGVDELPPQGPGERAARVSLSDQRALDLTVRLASPSPTIQVIYSDPHFSDSFDLSTAIESTAEDRDSLRLAVATTVEDSASPLNPSEIDVTTQSVVRPFYRMIAAAGFWWLPQIVTVAFALLLLAGFICLNRPIKLRKPSAPQLLAQSIAAEDALQARTDLVLHRTITLEESRPVGVATGLSRYRIEIWHSAVRRITARRLYDENGRLLSGEWTKDGAQSAIYHSHHAPSPSPQSQPEIQNNNRSLELWRLSPSARDFTALKGENQDARLEEQGDNYVLAFDETGNSHEVGNAQMVKVTLTLSKADLHATEMILWVQDRESTVRGEPSDQNNFQLRKYRMIESVFERRAPDSVAPSVFEPDSELLIPTAEPATGKSKLETASPAPGPQPLTPVLATADLEAEVLRLLSEAGADMDDQTTISRTSDGKLMLNGVVESNDRRAEILRALASVMNSPALTVKIETVADVVSRQKRIAGSNGPVSVQRVEVSKAKIPVDQELRRYLGRKEDSEADEEIRQVAAKVLNRSRLVMSEAGTLKRLAGHFSDEDLRTMSPDAHSKWLAVIRAHARNCEAEGKRLRGELQAIFFYGEVPVDVGPVEIKDDAGLALAASRLFDLVAANDRVIRAAFTISDQSVVTTAIRSTQFGGALKSAEVLAAKIARHQ